MHKQTEEKFLKSSLEILQKQLAEEGIITKKIRNFKETILNIGKLYHDLKKEEEI